MKYWVWLALALLPAHADYGTSSFGNLAYPLSFNQLHYTVEKAVPRDGSVIWGTLSPFNSFNPFIVRGTSMPLLGILCFARLLDETYDEIGSSYAYAAEDVETAPDYTWVKFHLRPNMTFSDGTPITAEDVAFSFQMRCDHHPMMKNYYRHVEKVEVIDSLTILFHCPNNKSQEIAGIIGQTPILPKAFFEKRDPGAPMPEPIPSSGPYKVASYGMGNFIELQRVDHWWGSNVPSQKGKYNIKTLRCNVYRDATVLIESFLAGNIDLCLENRIKVWEESYVGPAFDEGRICKSEIKHHDCSPTNGLFFNTRRPIFADIRVRQAISIMVNGPWLNTNLYQGRYKRNNSYFANSILAHKGLPEGEEKTILEPFRNHLPQSVWTKAPLETEETYEPEARRKQALALLSEAGWSLQDDRMMKGNTPLSFEILINSKTYEKLVLHLKNVLQSLGIHVNVRTIDRVVYEEKLDQLDFDMVFETIPQSLLPGNEQMSYWGSSAANQKGTMNYAGIRNPVVDALCEQLLTAKTYEKLCVYTHAIDRVLTNNCYIIPAWHFGYVLVGHKPHVKWVQPPSPNHTIRWLFETMWVDETSKPIDTPIQKPSLWQRVKIWWKES